MIDLSNKNQPGILNSILNRITESIDKRVGSLIYTCSAVFSKVMYDCYFLMDMIQKYTFVTFATGDFLDYRVAERGLARKKATPAVRRGYFDKEIELNTLFSTMNGDNSINFKVTEFEREDEGIYYYKLTSEVVGIIGNGYTGSIQPVSAISGLKVAQLSDILIPGAEEEDDESLRQRYIDTLNEKPFAGNIAAYREEILSQDGIGAVQVWPFWKGGGTVLCTILTSEYDLATEELIKKIQEIISPIGPDDNPTQNGVGFAPIGASVTINTAQKLNININFELQIKVGFLFDSVKDSCKASIEDYLLSLRKSWDSRIPGTEVIYECKVIHSQILAALIGTEGVLNIRNLLINESSDDLKLIESREQQQIPFIGDYDVSEITG